MQKRLHRIFLPLLIIGGLIGIGLFILLSTFWIRYGPVRSILPSIVQLTNNRDALIIQTAHPSKSKSGIIIFPANLTHPSQYEHFASDLATRLQQPVLIAKPTLRLENFAPDASQLQHLLPRVTRWVYIGHSAGAAAACRAADSAIKPSSIITITGYCTQPKAVADAFFATDDHILIRGVRGSPAAQTFFLPSNDHFFITNHAAPSPAYNQLLKQLIPLLSNT